MMAQVIGLLALHMEGLDELSGSWLCPLPNPNFCIWRVSRGMGGCMFSLWISVTQISMCACVKQYKLLKTKPLF